MTTYVLGAGASLHAGYPLLGELPEELRRWAKRTGSSEVSQIAWLCNSIAQRSGGGPTNLEQILTELDGPTSKKVTLSNGEWFYPHLLVASLPNLIAEFFDSLRTESDESAYRRFVAHIIEPGDAVITFNYDVALEKELAAVGKWDVGTGYGFPMFPERSSPVHVLKLHGSTNWKSVIEGQLGSVGTYNVDDPYAPRPMIPDRELQWLGFSTLKDPLTSRGGKLLGGSPQHTLLLPKMDKQFPGKMWSRLWEQAKALFKGSSRVVLAGYSLPAADKKARNLILRECSRSARIVLRCKSKTHALVGEFNSAGFSKIDADANQDFETWVNQEGRDKSKAVGESVT